MSTNYTTYTQHSNATITVTTSAELDAALASLSSGGGGTILMDGNGGPYDIYANGIGDANNPILIKAADPNNEPLVQNINLQSSSYITMTQLDVNSVGTGSTVHDLRVSNGDHIEFVDNSMTSDANGFWDGSSSVTQGGQAVLIRDSSNITFSNNDVANYDMGATFLEIQGLNFSNNEMSGMQGDGFRGGGIQNALIDNNYMHDFFGSLQTLNHTDFIQFWSTNTTLVSMNVEISNNVLDANGGSTSQGIFIGNELTRGGANGPMYQNFSIHDNVVHTASWHGLTIEGTNGVQVYNNAVLFDDQATGMTSPGSGWVQAEPFMLVGNTTNTSVYGNIAGKVTVNGILDNGTNNQLLDYRDSSAATFTDNFMNNLPVWDPNSGTSPVGNTGGTSGGTGTGTGTGGTDTSGGTGDADTGGGTSGTDTSGGTGDTDTGSGTGETDTGGDTETGGNTDTEGNEPNGGNSEGITTESVSVLMQDAVATLLTKSAIAQPVSHSVSAESAGQQTVSIEAILQTLTAPIQENTQPENEDIDELLYEFL